MIPPFSGWKLAHDAAAVFWFIAYRGMVVAAAGRILGWW